MLKVTASLIHWYRAKAQACRMTPACKQTKHLMRCVSNPNEGLELLMIWKNNI